MTNSFTLITMKAVLILAFVCIIQQASCNYGGYGSLGGYSGLGWGGINAPVGWGYGGGWGGYRGGYGGYGWGPWSWNGNFLGGGYGPYGGGLYGPGHSLNGYEQYGFDSGLTTGGYGYAKKVPMF